MKDLEFVMKSKVVTGHKVTLSCVKRIFKISGFAIVWSVTLNDITTHDNAVFNYDGSRKEQSYEMSCYEFDNLVYALERKKS